MGGSFLRLRRSASRRSAVVKLQLLSRSPSLSRRRLAVTGASRRSLPVPCRSHCSLPRRNSHRAAAPHRSHCSLPRRRSHLAAPRRSPPVTAFDFHIRAQRLHPCCVSSPDPLKVLHPRHLDREFSALIRQATAHNVTAKPTTARAPQVASRLGF